MDLQTVLISYVRKDIDELKRRMSVDQLEHLITQIEKEISAYSFIAQKYPQDKKQIYGVPYLNRYHKIKKILENELQSRSNV